MTRRSAHLPDSGDPWTITGDPTEAALLALAAKRGVDPADLLATCPRVEELTFDSDRRRMATLHADDEHVWVAVKGALEALGPLLDAAERPAAAAGRTAWPRATPPTGTASSPSPSAR